MKHYKLILNNQIVGVVCDSDFRRFQKKHGVVLVCGEDDVQFVEFHSKCYRAYWMNTVILDGFNVTTVEMPEIEQEEYDQLLAAFENDDAPIDEHTADDEIEQDVDITVDFLKESKVNEMSRICNQVITDGFDVTLSDESVHHFSLTIQDQLNLITLLAMVQNGETRIPYHADGELCKMFTAEDILAITNAATTFKTFHVTYYNSLKAYIESLETIEAISTVTYGMSIPEEYQSDILKELLAQISGN